MSRINCKTPSTGRPVNLTIQDLSVDWATLAEAPDFSVPDSSNVFTERDPLDVNRAIRPGEIFFMTPIFVRNKGEEECWVDVQLVNEDGQVIGCPGSINIPVGDTALVPLQGRSLIKRNAHNQFGERLQLRAQTALALDVWSTVEEKPSSEHIGVI